MAGVIGNIADKAVSAALGPVVKAVLEVCDEKGKVKASMQCGFNPTEYSISHNLRYINNNGINEPFQAKNLAFMKGMPATLSVSIVIDQKSHLDGSLEKLGSSVYNRIKYKGKSQPRTVKQVCQFLSEFMHYDSREKDTPLIGFSWGDMRFVGRLTRLDTKFTMFDRDGSPIRAKLGLSIIGDDTYFMKKTITSGGGASAARAAASALGALNPRNLI